MISENSENGKEENGIKQMRQVAVEFLARHFPNCRAAILAGSAASGKATDFSDVDLVILDDTQPGPFRAAYTAFGWPIEVFVMTTETYPFIFEINQYHANPSLQRMCASGMVLKDDGMAQTLVSESRHMLAAGPWPWEQDEIDQARFEISEGLNDLQGSSDRAEDLFIVNRMIARLQEFQLRMHGCWSGEGKWGLRALMKCDESFSSDLITHLEAFYRHGRKEGFIRFVEQCLEPFGGKLFDGFRLEG